MSDAGSGCSRARYPASTRSNSPRFRKPVRGSSTARCSASCTALAAACRGPSSATSDAMRSPAGDRIASLVAELGPRLAAAKAVHDAEQRAVLDPLTGLRNRGEFERVLAGYRAREQPLPASLIYVDLDHFK